VRTFKKTPKKSLRTILFLSYLFISVAPLGFVTVYSMKRFERALDNELSQRLASHAREVQTIINDYRNGFLQKRDRYSQDANLLYHLSSVDVNGLRDVGTLMLQQDFSHGLTFYDRQARLIISLSKDSRGRIQENVPTQESVVLSANYALHLKENRDLGIVDLRQNKKMLLLLISRINSQSGRLVGYVQQTLQLERAFVERLRAKLKLEVFFFRNDSTVILSSHNDFYKSKQKELTSFFQSSQDNFFETMIAGEPYGFLIQPMEWESSKFFMAVGVSKKEAKGVIQTINFAFLSVVGTVMIFLVGIVYLASNWVLKPLYDLVDALQSFESQDQAVSIPVRNDTEVGLLTESFNEMSFKIQQSRLDLKNKIRELEKTNSELKDTQAKLIHSAKMISLGQLVAGVAHELNNPIGFIYSNMEHLKDYSNKLIQLVDVAEKNPQELGRLKEAFELDYIRQDLPKLIQSCEDGARRTKDIVIGLRNFSRLERANLKEVAVQECLDNTLELLQGEIKNRIVVHKTYEPTSKIMCIESQINQVFMNILSNATQAISGQGQVWITLQSVKAGAKHPEAKGSFAKDGVLISIQDTGSGIEKKDLEKIFDPFFTTKGVGQGTGLGLSISYGIIHDHGGEILVRSEVGVGTEFTVYLPLKPPLGDKT
jgi:two-component system, NtrC family, sensor kinase